MLKSFLLGPIYLVEASITFDFIIIPYSNIFSSLVFIIVKCCTVGFCFHVLVYNLSLHSFYNISSGMNISNNSVEIFQYSIYFNTLQFNLYFEPSFHISLSSFKYFYMSNLFSQQLSYEKCHMFLKYNIK